MFVSFLSEKILKTKLTLSSMWRTKVGRGNRLMDKPFQTRSTSATFGRLFLHLGRQKPHLSRPKNCQKNTEDHTSKQHYQLLPNNLYL